jgi:CubicO group peptidase (beta-lactamase class C family)
LRRLGPIAFFVALAGAVAPAAAAAAEPATDYAGVRAALSREIPKAMKASGTMGLTIALVDGERTVWARGFGWADKATKTPVTDETLFHIGSASKTMTATAVMQLVEEGRVDLDAPLSRYVPGFSLLARFPGNKITVRSVLDMHSGIPAEINNGSFTVGGPNPGYNRFLLRDLAKDYPERPVDTAYSYSNSGYELLRNVVEGVTGEGFDAYARAHLFGPVGMPHTTYDDATVSGHDLSRGYQAAPTPAGGVRTVARPREYVNTWGPGSVVSSGAEMASYLKTMIAGGVAPGGDRVLSESTLKEMITPQTDLPLDISSFRPGLGWFIGDRGNSWMGQAIYWDGDSANFHTFMRWLPRLGIGVFVSVNTSPTVDVRELIGLRAIGLMVTAKTGRTAPKPAPPAPVAKASAAKLRRAAGLYANSTAGIYRVAPAGEGLRLTPPFPTLTGVGSVTMLPRADGWYAEASPSPERPLSELWIKPVTVAGHRLLLAHSYGSPIAPAPDGAVTTFGEKVPSDYRIPPAWRSRLGIYRATNMVPGTYPDVPRLGRLSIYDGVLQWDGVPVEASDARLAFTFGFSSPLVQRGAGSSIVAAGRTLTTLGVRYRLRKPEAARPRAPRG